MPRQLKVHTGLTPEDLARIVKSQGGQPFALRDVSNGRSGCSEDTLSGNP